MVERLAREKHYLFTKLWTKKVYNIGAWWQSSTSTLFESIDAEKKLSLANVIRFDN
jgi:hypothetical protein